MIKVFLKSSVSALVLLGAITTLNPSFAGNNGLGGEKDPSENKNISSKQKNQDEKNIIRSSTKKSKSKKLNFEDAATKIEDFSFLYQNLDQHDVILKFILFARGIDPQSIKNTSLVCKKWHSLIAKEKQLFLNTFLNSSTGSLPFLQNFFVHPSALVVAENILGPQFPYQLVYSKFNSDLEKINSQELINGQVPKNIENYVLAVNACSSQHFFLCNHFIQLDPLNFKTVGLAAHIIGQSRSLKAGLSKFLEESSIEPEQFSELIEDSQSHGLLKNHLMTLKLLALSGDEFAIAEMKKFEAALSDHFQENILINRIMSGADKNPDFLNQPLWSTYMINTGEKTLLFPELNDLQNLMRSQYANQLELNPLESFGRYVFALAPQLENLIHFYQNLDDLKSLRGAKSFSSERLAFLDSQYKGVDQQNLPTCVFQAWNYFKTNQYQKAMEVLKDAHGKVADSPYRFRILYEMAEIILAANDQESFSAAEDYLLAINAEFERTQNPTLNIDYIYTVEVEGEKKTTTHPATLDILDFIPTLCALQIYNGEFKNAYENLKHFEVLPSIDLDDCKSLIKALQIQHSVMPKKLKELFKDELMFFATASNRPETLKIMCESEELFGSVLKSHPLDKRKFKKEVKSIKKEFKPEILMIEEEEVEVSSSKKSLSLSSKKDKKDKKYKK